MLAKTEPENNASLARALLSAEGVSKHFGGVYAVDDVSLKCSANEVVGLIGPNGAGKTTFMNVVSGTVVPEHGKISVNGRNVAGLPPEQCARLGVARTFQNIRLFGKLTVRQNIEVAFTTAVRYRDALRDSNEPEELLNLLGLDGLADQKAETLAYGTQRRVEIARALALSPYVLLLDEPAAGMNEQETQALSATIRQVRGRFSFAIVVIDHDLRFILELCHRIYVMHMGKIIAEGPPSVIREDPNVREVYLGNKRMDT